MTRSSALRSAPLRLLPILTPLGLAQVAGGGPQTMAMSPEHLHQRQEGETALLVLDVRDPAEYRAGHVPSAVNLPAAQMTGQAAGQLSALRGLGGLVVYCIGGARTELAGRTSVEHGVPNVFHLPGGSHGLGRHRVPGGKGGWGSPGRIPRGGDPSGEEPCGATGAGTLRVTWLTTDAAKMAV